MPGQRPGDRGRELVAPLGARPESGRRELSPGLIGQCLLLDDLAVGIYIGGLPAAAVFLASISEVDVWLTARSAVRFHRADGRYLPGGGRDARGYTIRTTADACSTPLALDLGALWEDPRASSTDGHDSDQELVVAPRREQHDHVNAEEPSWH